MILSSLPANPFLYINVNVLDFTSDRYVNSIVVRLDQRLQSLVTNERFWGTTWNVSLVGTTRKGNLRTLRDVIQDQVNKFINDYLAANPRR